MMKNIFPLCFLFLFITVPGFAQSNLFEPTTTTYKKAKSILIEEIKFNETSLSEVIAFFTRESVAVDPSKNGLNFVVKTPADPAAKEPYVTMNLKKIPLTEALKYVAAMTNYQVKYEEQAIFLTPPEVIKKTDSAK